MEIKITKKTFIYLGIILVFGFICFCFGRFTRPSGASGTSQSVVDGIVLEREAIDRIADGLNIEGASIKSADDLGRAIEDGLKTSGRSFEIGRVCTNAIAESIKADQEFSENLRRDLSDSFDTTEYAFDLAINRAELYESIVRTYNGVCGDSGEDPEKSE